MPAKLKIKIGEKFNRLTIIKEVEPHILPCGVKYRKVLCQCECGNIKEIGFDHLIRGKIKSCGCLLKEKAGKTIIHGFISAKYENKTKFRFYCIWSGILKRCNNKNCKAYQNYGGRGIKNEWKSFIEFKKDMYGSYLIHCKKFTEKNTSIERKNVNGNYCKKNCEWATYKKQANNTRKNRFITYKRKTQTVAQWADELNISYTTLWERIKRNWSIKKSLLMPIDIKKRNFNLKQ